MSKCDSILESKFFKEYYLNQKTDLILKEFKAMGYHLMMIGYCLGRKCPCPIPDAMALSYAAGKTIVLQTPSQSNVQINFFTLINNV